MTKKKKTEENQESKAPECETPPITVMDIDYEKLESEASEYKDKYLRLLAESENSRKRMQKERKDMLKFAVQDVIVDILRPLDQFEKALKFAESSSEDVRNWAVGFEMIAKQFKDVFVDHGVKSYNVKEGDHFDPHYHEAVELVETEDHEAGTVIKVLSKGYTMGERTIRPAHVQVAKQTEKKQEEKLEENKDQE
jgi:molecular chaperone GrpE